MFQALEDLANSIPGCGVLDVQSDGDHNNRYTYRVGSPGAMEEAAFRLAKQAAETIDMTKHTGQHPRMGAVDVIPFVPTMDMTVEECVALSRRVAGRIWEELAIPVYLYEDAATVAGSGQPGQRPQGAVRGHGGEDEAAGVGPGLRRAAAPTPRPGWWRWGPGCPSSPTT